MFERLRQIRAAVVGDWEKYLIGKMRGHSSIEMGSIGGSVSEQTALAISVHLACVRAIGEDVGGLSLKVYERLEGDGQRAEIPDHPISRVIRKPNDWMTQQEFFSGRVSTAVAFGNAYSEIQFDSRYNPVALIPLSTPQMDARISGGQMTYRYLEPNGEKRFIDPASIWHLKGASLDGFFGMSVIEQCPDAFALARVQEIYGLKFFENSARGDVYFQHPGVMSPDAQSRFKDAINSRHLGVGNAHKAMILEEGVTVSSTSMPIKDIMLIESRRMSDIQILGLHRMPPHKIGILDRATFSNIEHQAIQYVTDVVQPWSQRVAESLMRCLMGSGERKRIYVEHNYDSLLRADVKSRNEALAVLRNIGVLSVNDCRKMLNMVPIDGGDIYLQPLNMVDVTKPVAPADKVAA